MLALDRALSLEREHDGNVAVTVITTASSDVQIQKHTREYGNLVLPTTAASWTFIA